MTETLLTQKQTEYIKELLNQLDGPLFNLVVDSHYNEVLICKNGFIGITISQEGTSIDKVLWEDSVYQKFDHFIDYYNKDTKIGRQITNYKINLALEAAIFEESSD